MWLPCRLIIFCLVFAVSFCAAFPLVDGGALHEAIAELSLPPLTLEPQQHDFSTFDLTDALQPAYITSASPPTYINAPENLLTSCSAYVGPDQECTSNMTATSVRFEDCGADFIVCRCADAEMSMATALERFGRVPVGLRRYAGTIVILSDSLPHAYTLTTGDTHLFGDCEVDAWIHEMMHAFDFAVDAKQSDAAGWDAALAADSCVPDAYSTINRVEDFAQVGVLKIYSLLYGTLPPGFSADCMANQLGFMNTFALFDPGPLFGNNCDIIDGGPPPRYVLYSFLW
ncbi:hypothetical protein C8R43DRAFT_133233 [Mycena crocata]|nr:hypothetical protein C8R43DRAFT_133233 [Mycena crocata]